MADGWPRDRFTCAWAAKGCHLVPRAAVLAQRLQLFELSTPRRCVTKVFLTRQATSPLQALQRA